MLDSIKREEREEGWRDRSLHLSNLSALSLNCSCVHTDNLASNKPLSFDSMVTWRHMIGMSPNIALLQLTIYSSTHCLIKPKPRADSNSRQGSWHVSQICWNFVKDSSMIASAGVCCPYIPLNCFLEGLTYFILSQWVLMLDRCTFAVSNRSKKVHSWQTWMF